MKIVAISDSHGQHRDIKDLPEADVIIHAGDISSVGRPKEVRDFLDWFSKLPYKYRIFVAGNHDFFFDYDWKAATVMGRARFENQYAGIYIKEQVDAMLAEFPGVTYLNDSSIDIDGVKIWGSPITPWFHDWAFNRARGEEIKKHWDLIPLDTDILITHGPVDKILDRTMEGDHTGCEELLKKVLETNVKFHICGHIHEGYGTYETGDGRAFINASVLNRDYRLINKPIVFEFNKDSNQ
jgi:Icc-related predicted phosphoesterase